MTGEILTAAGLALTRETAADLSRERGEPDWLLAVRLAAFDAFSVAPLPTLQTEGWRRTSLNGLPLADLTVLPRVDDTVRSLSDAPPSSTSAHVMSLSQALEDGALAERVRQQFGQVVRPNVDKFTALHYAFFNAATVVHVRRNAVLEEPIWIRHTAAFAHTLIILDEGAQASIVDEYVDAPALSSAVVEQVLGANASLRYAHLQRWSSETWSFSAQRAKLAQDAQVRTLNAVLGARLARNSVQVALDGRGSQADLLGIVALDGRQHADFQTLQDHTGNATRSDLVIHNALRGRSSANFTGLIRINKPAHQTESSQEQKNILLSPRARADSDPKLEILNNDVVRCTHGAAVGPVDPEMLFYLESRGLDRASAEQLIVEGFFQSTIDKLGAPRLQEEIWTAVAEHV